MFFQHRAKWLDEAQHLQISSSWIWTWLALSAYWGFPDSNRGIQVFHSLVHKWGIHCVTGLKREIWPCDMPPGYWKTPTDTMDVLYSLRYMRNLWHCHTSQMGYDRFSYLMPTGRCTHNSAFCSSIYGLLTWFADADLKEKLIQLSFLKLSEREKQVYEDMTDTQESQKKKLKLKCSYNAKHRTNQ